MLAQEGIERAVVTRNSGTSTQVFLDKLRQQLTDNRHRYPHLEPTNIFSEVANAYFDSIIYLYANNLPAMFLHPMQIFFHSVS